jgi:tetratricopeptide (TPR) repeat protein
MADKQATITDTEVEKNEIVERAKGFWARFSKPIIYIGGAIILLAGGWLGYKNLVKTPNETKSAEQIFPAEQLFDKMTQQGFNKDSITLVLNGGNGITGVLKVAGNYGSTAAGNRAHFIAGACYLHNKDFNNAVKHLKEFSTISNQPQSAAYRMLGDAYSELKKNDDALTYYKKAVDVVDVKDESTRFLSLSRLALFCEATGKTKEAIGYYQQIKDEITPAFLRDNRIDFQVDKYLARLGVTK